MAQRNPSVRGLGVCVAAAALCLAAPRPAAAQEGPLTPWVGEKGITETVAQIMARQALLPDWKPEDGVRMVEEFRVDRRFLPQNPDSPAVAFWPPAPGVSPVTAPEMLPGGGRMFLPQTIGTTFLMSQQAASSPGYVPPDTCGSVSLTQVMEQVNGLVRVYSKAGVLGALSTFGDNFWSTVRNASPAVDPQIMYDHITDRWFLVAINETTPDRVLIAVSSPGTITSTSNFTFFQFTQDQVAPVGNSGQFADHPKAGIDANALYIGCNMFGGSFVGTTGWVVNKAALLSSNLVVTAFRNIGTTTGGIYTPTGVTNDDPAATEGYFVGPDATTFGRVVLRRVSNPGGSPTISANLNVTVPTTANPIAVPAFSAITLDAIDDRIQQGQIHRNRATGARTLWAAHNIQVNTSGVGNASGGRDAMRWYEIQNLTSTPSLRQSGTLFDNAAASPINYWMGACTMSGQGHMALGSTRASDGQSIRPEISVAGRLVGDTLGTIQAPTTAQTSVAQYNSGGTQRWGDYSSAWIDPSDDQSIWVIQEYCSSTNNWGIRAIKLLAPPPATPVSCSPASVAQGASNVNVTVTGTTASGSAFYDTDATYTQRLAAAVSGTGVTVNSVTFTDTTHFTMNVSVAAGATASARNVAATNPDLQTATGTGILTVTSSSVCPSFSQHPTGLLLCQGSDATFTVAASGNPAPTYQWRKDTVNLSDGGSISGSQTVQLTVTGITPGDAGSYDCVATNACGSTTSNAASLSVTVAPQITSNPADQSVNAVYHAATFSVAASGTSPSYQWRKNGSNLTDGGTVTGSQTQTLTFNPADLSDTGSTIDCFVSNGCGGVFSTAANYTAFCVADFNQDGFVNGDDFDAFSALFDAGDPAADVNNDGFTNGDDFDVFSAAFDAGC